MNIFAKASKTKLTFTTKKGLAILGDLWDLPISNLKTMANELNRSITAPDDLFSLPNPATAKDSLRLKVILEVVTIREEENKTAAAAGEVDQRRALLTSLIERKKLEATSDMSIKDLEKQLKALT